MIKLEVIGSEDGAIVESWQDIDEKYGRIVAYQAQSNGDELTSQEYLDPETDLSES